MHDVLSCLVKEGDVGKGTVIAKHDSRKLGEKTPNRDTEPASFAIPESILFQNILSSLQFFNSL